MSILSNGHKKLVFSGKHNLFYRTEKIFLVGIWLVECTRSVHSALLINRSNSVLAAEKLC